MQPPQPLSIPRRAWGLVLVSTAWVALVGPVHADTIVLTSGKRVEGVVVSRQDSDVVIVNPFNSRHPDMTFGVEDKHRIPADEVEEVIESDPPLVEYRRRAAALDLSADDHFELAQFCAEHKFKEERLLELERALSADPDHAEALKAYGAPKWKGFARGNPEADQDLQQWEREYLKLTAPEELAAQWSLMREKKTRREVLYLERARRSAQFAPGRRDKVKLTLRSDEAPGATYCIYVPKSYDPLVPTGLVVGLHGGGPDGEKGELVNGSGEAAMPFYQQETLQWGCIVVCPTALRAGWPHQMNHPWMDALLEEMQALYNIDLDRIYLTGHSMGGFGSFYWGSKLVETWAAVSPCAGGGSLGEMPGKGLPIYLYHGADDDIVGPGSTRAAAKSLLGKSKGRKHYDFVYTELSGVRHGFPDWVRKDIFRFFAGRRRDVGRRRSSRPRSSFDLKQGKVEKKTFGDASRLPATGSAAARQGGEASLGELVKQLQKGGGGGVDAAEALAARKDPKTVKALSKVLRSKGSTPDARVLAVQTLGQIPLEDSVKALDRVAEDEDYRVVEATARALGATKLSAAADPLARATARLGEIFSESLRANRISFGEYKTRLASFELALAGWSDLGPEHAATALPAIETSILRRVYLPEQDHVIPTDYRFHQIPPQSRASLAKVLVDTLTTLADPAVKPLLVEVRDRWEAEGPLRAQMDRGITELD